MYYTEYETESRERRMKRKWKGCREVLFQAERSSREFQSRLKKMGACASDFKSFEDYGKIPPLGKQALIRWQKERGFDALIGCAPGELSRIYEVSGAVFGAEGREDDYWAWAEGFFAAGFRPADVAQMTFSYQMGHIGLMLEEPLRDIGCAVIPAGPGNVDKQIEYLKRLPVTAYVGLASFLHSIGRQAVAHGYDLHKDFKLEKAYVAGEALSEGMRQEVEDMFGITVRQGYGSAHVGCIAYECMELGGMHLSNYRHVEICDPETGEPLPDGEIGEVVVTPFFEAHPLVRFATGDLSSIDDSACECGRTARKLTGWKGSVEDSVKVRGEFLFPSQVAIVFNNYPKVTGWQVRIKNRSGRENLVVLVETADEICGETFVADFQNRLKLKPVVEFVEPGTIPADAPKFVDERTFD